ncbi:DUF4159 domain-containing protein [Lacipirellula sp.]|uniref:DUF4159 domain-containing protein n=1 Tax=Lacipirellula sp. TaxID=2691419 RepID=UPI003D0D66A4
MTKFSPRLLTTLPLLIAVLANSLALNAKAQDAAGITSAQVNEAIARGVRYLKSQQLPDGAWEERALYAGGLTPLATLALLQAGCDPKDEAVAKALKYLRNFRPEATYTASLQTMVFCAAEPERDRLLIERNVKWLEDHQIRDGAQSGMWAIPTLGTPDHTDNSMTHMAMLALYEAERVGVAATDETWRLALDYWRREQNPDGSWGWGPDYPGTGSMTAAGIASVLAASERLEPSDARVQGDAISCCNPQTPNKSVDLGMSWLRRNFSVNRNPGVDYWHSYYMFALERVGRITAQRFIGDHDWYREGAEVIVGMQLPDGSWPSDLDEEHLDDLRVPTSFYLMFLAKGRRPLVLAHVKHEPVGDWRRHRGALLHLVASVEREWKLPLAHQVVDIGPATVEDLLQTPVLYISGHDAPQFTAEEKEKLRMYVDRGGFLFFDQSCLGGGFDAGVRELIAELFPNPDTKLRPLPPSHPIWRMERPVDPTTAPPVYGVEVSCRTAVVYVPDDLGCRWELLGRNRELSYPPAVRARVEQAETLGLNILAYATNREVGYKDPAVPTPDGGDDADDSRGTIRIANILHPGGCEGAPGALRNLLHLADHHLRIIIAVPQEVSLSSPTLFSNNFLMFHGRTAFTLTPAERKGLREFVERGGTVLADAICSSKEFTDSLRTELKEIFPESPLAPISADDPLFTTEYGGYDLAKVTRRRNSGGTRDAESGGVASIESEEPPQLEAVTIDGRHVIIFSPHDLSCSLEGAAPQCEGYTRQDAARISLNALLYAIH